MHDDVEAKEKILDMWSDCLNAQKNIAKSNNVNSKTKYSYKTYNVAKLDSEQLLNAESRNHIVISNDDELNFKISESLTNNKIKENYIIGAIDNDLKKKITNDVGQNIFKQGQYSFVVSSDDIRHISEHFHNTNDIFDAIFKLYDTVNNYDTVELNTTHGTQKELVFSKSYREADYLAVEVTSKKIRSLRLKTFYLTKNN